MDLLCQDWYVHIQPWQRPKRPAGPTFASHINRGSVVDPGTSQGTSHLTHTVTLFGSEVSGIDLGM